jgi:hypothetical protein
MDVGVKEETTEETIKNIYKHIKNIIESNINMVDDMPNEVAIGYSLALSKIGLAATLLVRKKLVELGAENLDDVDTNDIVVGEWEQMDVVLDLIAVELVWLETLFKKAGLNFLAELRKNMKNIYADSKTLSKKYEKIQWKEVDFKKVDFLNFISSINEKTKYIT